MKDIWIIPQEETDILKGHVGKIIDTLRDTGYYSQARILSDDIVDRVDRIVRQQNLIGVSIDQKLSNYETDIALLKEVKKDIGILEDLAIEVRGLSAERILGESPLTVESVRAEAMRPEVEKLGTI